VSELIELLAASRKYVEEACCLGIDERRLLERIDAALAQPAVDLRLLQNIAKAASALCDEAEEVECENGLGLWAQHGQWEPLHEALETISAAPEPTP
jgi:hypothetical protein